MAVRRNYRINLRNYGNPPAIMVSQYDENYDLVFEVYDGVVPATGLNAYTVKLVGRQPGDDPALKYEFTGTVSGIANNILSFTIDTTMTGRAGKGTAEIVILDTTNDVKFASFNLPVYVEKAAVPDDAIDADVERAQEIAEEVQEIVDTAAAEVKGEAEAWAVGERDGEPVPSTDPTYHNNAKYYSEVAQDIADSIGIDATLSISGKAADAKKTGDEISSLKEDLNAEYVGFRRYLTASDSAIAVPVGVYGISASSSAKPSNLPSNFPSSNNGLLIALDKSSGQVDYATDYICIANYSRKVWFYTQYEWIEIVNTNMANSLISSAVNNAYKYIYDYLCPDIVHIAKESYIKGSAFSTTNTQYKFLGTSGVEDVATSYPDWYVSNDITVEPFTFYYVTASAKYSGHQLYQFIDSSGNIIGYEAATSSSTLAVSDKLIYSPANAVKIRIASVNGSSGIKLYSATEKSASMKWVGKKWACMGDSLTAENIRTTMHYHDYIAQKTGITVVNLGAGGTGYKREFNNVSGFMDRVDTIPLDSDVVTIFGSGNDNIYTVGNPSDTGTDTLCGCINTTISRIFERITTCQLGIVTPTPWQSFNPADDTNWMSEYSDAIVQICKNWGIPCLDLYHCSNLRPWDADFRTAAYSKDDGGGTHPDETGHALIAPRFEAFLDELLMH